MDKASPLSRREALAQAQEALLAWFDAHMRPLPWRRDYDPYRVWISEIMLQQTQMERGVQYFERWMAAFPTRRRWQGRRRKRCSSSGRALATTRGPAT